MKKTFEYIGLFVLVIFSFYYTDKVVKMVNKNDPLMEQITTYASANNTSCIEGYTTDEGIILGVSGLKVDENKSYSNMKGFGFNEELFVFEELIKDGNDILYGGNNKEDFNKFYKIIDDLKINTYCIYNNFDVINICKNKSINSVKTDLIYTKDILLNIKKTLEKGNIYILKENKYTVEELSSSINHINGKGVKITSLNELLN